MPSTENKTSKVRECREVSMINPKIEIVMDEVEQKKKVLLQHK